MPKSVSGIKKIRKKTSIRKKESIFTNKGFSGFFVIITVIFAVFLAGAFSSIDTQLPIQGIPDPNNPFKNTTDKKTLQLRTLGFITVTPIPTSAPPAAAPINVDCQQNLNTESGILVGSDPAPGGTIQNTGKIRVWVNDEGPPFVSPGEVVDPNSGQITTPGDRTAKDTLSDGGGKYLWEPAIYLTSVTTANSSGPFTGDAENGGTPYFPSIIKGDFDPHNFNGKAYKTPVAPSIDADYVNFENGPDYIKHSSTAKLPEQYTAEFIWDLTSLKLTPGTYHVEEIIHDGDVNLAINCVAFQL